MVFDYLTQEEADIIETAKEKKKLIKEREELEKSKKELKPKKFGIKDVLSTKVNSKKSKSKKGKSKKIKIFNGKPELPDYTKEEKIMRGLFGRGDKILTNFDGRSLPKINNVLISGGGLLNSGDRNKETASIFGIRRF